MKRILRWAPTVFACLAVAAGMAAESTYNDYALFPITVRDKYGAINRAGEVVIEPEYDEPIALREGLARARKGARVAYLDAAGKRVMEPQERTAELFSQGLAPARGPDTGGVMRHGYVSHNGEWAIEPRFADAKAFSASRAAVWRTPE